jgi:hypothetical protein
MHDEPQLAKNIRNIITGESNIKFAYLFGSRAENKITLLSDTDIAVYLNGRTNHFKYRLKLIESFEYLPFGSGMGNGLLPSARMRFSLRQRQSARDLWRTPMKSGQPQWI